MIKHYNNVVIGAGMSGLAAAIRLSTYNKNTLLIEKHFLPGGLNSYFGRGKYKLDVGLHALTNYASKGSKGKILLKILRQLRIPYDQLKLQEQNFSKIVFNDKVLKFSNDISLLKSQIQLKFPKQSKNFEQLIAKCSKIDHPLIPQFQYKSAKKEVKKIITDPLLMEMIFCPLLFYGSSWEEDSDFNSFKILFRSIFLEGFSKPQGGMRPFLKLLTDRLVGEGAEISLNKEVRSLERKDDRWLIYLNNKDIISSNNIISTIGYPETYSLLNSRELPPTGKHSFIEVILSVDREKSGLDEPATIVFYNSKDRFKYKNPPSFVDTNSAIICFPDHYGKEEHGIESLVRVTMLANYDKWNSLDKDSYLVEKEKVLQLTLNLLQKLYPNFKKEIIFHNIFTPKTIYRYTGRLKGAIYGSGHKLTNGQTDYKGLYLAGTDQGLLGVVGSLLSGITIANKYGI